MAEIADKLRLQRAVRIIKAAAAWEREAQMLSAREYEDLSNGLHALAAAIDLLTPALPDDLQP